MFRYVDAYILESTHRSVITHRHWKQCTVFINLMYRLHKNGRNCCGEYVSAHSIINLSFSIMYILTDPANYDRFYLEFLETSQMRYVSAYFTFRSMTCGQNEKFEFDVFSLS